MSKLELMRENGKIFCPLINAWHIETPEEKVRQEYIELITFSGNAGSVIYLKNYLETMFQFPHSSIDKMKVSQSFQLRISDEYDYQNQRAPTVSPQDTPVSAWNNGMGWFELIDPETYQVFRVSSLPE